MKVYDKITYRSACLILGNGSFDDGKKLLLHLAAAVQAARQKHPVFAEGKYHALGVIYDEVKELELAVEHESRARQISEALDVVVTCLRFILGEHENDKKAAEADPE